MSNDITAKLAEALQLSREYVEDTTTRTFDGTNGYGIRHEAKRRLALVDEALSDYRQHTEAQAGGTEGADREAFQAALEAAGYLRAELNQRGDGWLFERDHDRYVGWELAHAALAAAPAAAQGDVREQFSQWLNARRDQRVADVFHELGLAIEQAAEIGRQQGMSQANALWEMAKAETTGDRCAPCTKRCDDCPIDWARLTAEPTTPSKVAILDAVTKLFPRWREDIQEKFVLQVAHAVLALRPAEMAKAEQAVPVAVVTYHRDDEGQEAVEAYAKIVASVDNDGLKKIANWVAHGARVTLGPARVTATRKDWVAVMSVSLAAPPATERRPLTDERIDQVLAICPKVGQQGIQQRREYARAIEREHGITAGTTEQAKEQNHE